MRFPLAVASALLLAAALAGCSDAGDGPAPGLVTGPARDDAAEFAFVKVQVGSSAPSLLGLLPAEPVATIGTASGSRLLLALDLQAGSSPLRLRIVDPAGATVDQAQPTATGKRVLEVASTPVGDYLVYAESESEWSLGIVATVFPPGFDEGTRLQVATPEQRRIEHAFHPTDLAAAAGEPTRITLYDFDPHDGIENLQHNLHFPALGLKTAGKTTWGEVRVLDLPGLAAGTYDFECEFHGFTGTLDVA